MRTLVLDQGYQPARVVPWQKAIGMLYVGKADMLEQYDELIRSVQSAIPMPSVVRLRKGKRFRRKHVKFSRMNVMLRDGFACQYCGKQAALKELTYDHVVPRSRGGQTTWENIVTACKSCNGRKGARTPQEARMPLLKVPIRPRSKGRETFHVSVPREELQTPETWRFWLGEP